MKITPAALAAQYEKAVKVWPFITDVERQYKLPPFILFAVGSRETNLTNKVGDHGHGHGVFQLDDRSHQIPAGFDQDVFAQATQAAKMVYSNYSRCKTWVGALAMYNSGSCQDSHTTGGDYGVDTESRRLWLADHYSSTPPEVDVPKPLDITSSCDNPAGPGYWEQSYEGGLYNYDGAPVLHGYNEHSSWHAGGPRGFYELKPCPHGMQGVIQVSTIPGQRYEVTTATPFP